MSNDGFVAGVILTALIFSLVVCWQKKEIDDSWQHQIEAHGCAEFYLDANKDRQWHWKDMEP